MQVFFLLIAFVSTVGKNIQLAASGQWADSTVNFTAFFNELQIFFGIIFNRRNAVETLIEILHRGGKGS